MTQNAKSVHIKKYWIEKIEKISIWKLKIFFENFCKIDQLNKLTHFVIVNDWFLLVLTFHDLIQWLTWRSGRRRAADALRSRRLL